MALPSNPIPRVANGLRASLRRSLLRVRSYRPDINATLSWMQGLGAPVAATAARVPFVFVKRGSLHGQVMRANDAMLVLLADARKDVASVRGIAGKGTAAVRGVLAGRPRAVGRKGRAK